MNTLNAEQLARKHLVESAAFWFNAARKDQSAGRMPEALLSMENAYNHVENALYAEQQKVTAHAKELAELRERLDYQHQLGRNIAEERDTLRAQLADSQKRVRELEASLNTAHRTVGFFASVIKSGEDWSASCDSFYHDVFPARQSPKQEGM